MIKKHKIVPFAERVNPKTLRSDIDLPLYRNYMQEMGFLSQWDDGEHFFSEEEKVALFVPPLLGRLELNDALYIRNLAL